MDPKGILLNPPMAPFEMQRLDERVDLQKRIAGFLSISRPWPFPPPWTLARKIFEEESQGYPTPADTSLVNEAARRAWQQSLSG